MEEQLMEILRGITKKIEYIVVVDKTGLPILSIETETKKRMGTSMETVIAGIGSAILSLAESTSATIDQGGLKELIIRNEEGNVILIDAGESAILVGILPSGTSLDSPLMSLKIAASKIKKLKMPSSPEPPKPEDSDIFIPEID